MKRTGLNASVQVIATLVSPPNSPSSASQGHGHRIQLLKHVSPARALMLHTYTHAFALSLTLSAIG